MLFYSYKEDLVTNDGLILKGQRIVIPDNEEWNAEENSYDTLEYIHTREEREN